MAGVFGCIGLMSPCTDRLLRVRPKITILTYALLVVSRIRFHVLPAFRRATISASSNINRKINILALSSAPEISAPIINPAIINPAIKDATEHVACPRLEPCLCRVVSSVAGLIMQPNPLVPGYSQLDVHRLRDPQP